MVTFAALGWLFVVGASESPVLRGPEWNRALATIRAEQLKEHLIVLSSDAYEGRCAGEAGCERAAGYIIERLKSWKLEPGGDDGGYLQYFEFRVRGGKGGRAKTANIVAVLEGTDEKLRPENVVLGAHYDHVGTAGSLDAGRAGGATDTDKVWNGADDNGSGTVALLEIAEAFVETGIKPRRSIAFIWFSAEEQGLLGSAHYCASPLGKPVAMVNLDMVGRNPDKALEISGMGSMRDQGWFTSIDRALEVAPSLKIEKQAGSVPGSDDYSFIRTRVPAVALFSGYHKEYHKIGDHVDLIDFERMATIAKFSMTLVGDLADSDSVPEFEPPLMQTGQGKILGIEHEVLEDSELDQLGRAPNQGAVRVTSVLPGSQAEKIGLRAGDVIVSVRGRDLSRDSAGSNLRRAIRGAAYGEDHPLKILRDGAEVELKFRFERKESDDAKPEEASRGASGTRG